MMGDQGEEQLVDVVRLAQLDLTPQRRQLVLEQLRGLLEDADAVNRFMAARRGVSPSIRFEVWGAGDGS